MHHPRSSADVLRFKVLSFLLPANSLFAVVSIGLLVRSLLNDERQLTLIVMGMLLLSLILLVVQWVMGSRARCPLCQTPVLVPRQCVKHRHARTLLGSHRLRVAMSILFKNQFRCPYCNEATVMEARETLHRARMKPATSRPPL